MFDEDFAKIGKIMGVLLIMLLLSSILLGGLTQALNGVSTGESDVVGVRIEDGFAVAKTLQPLLEDSSFLSECREHCSKVVIAEALNKGLNTLTDKEIEKYYNTFKSVKTSQLSVAEKLQMYELTVEDVLRYRFGVELDGEYRYLLERIKSRDLGYIDGEVFSTEKLSRDNREFRYLKLDTMVRDILSS